MLPDISPAVHPKNAQWYAQHYYAVEDDIIPVFEKLDTPLLDRLLKPGMRVLDAMMGRGRHAVRYAQAGCIVTGNDLNPHMVAFARTTAKAANVPKGRLRLRVGDATRLPDRDGAYDATIALFSAVGTIPHSRKRQAAISEMARVTKRDGLVVIHAHNRLDGFFSPGFIVWSWRNLIRPDNGLERGDIITDYNGLRRMFNHFYTPGEFHRSFRRAGLRVIEEHYHNYPARKEIRGPFKRWRADGFIYVGKKR